VGSLALDEARQPEKVDWQFAPTMRRQVRQRFAGGQLHGQPLIKAILIAEDAAHFGPSVTRNHVLELVSKSDLVSKGFSGPARLGDDQTRKQGPAIQSLRGH